MRHNGQSERSVLPVSRMFVKIMEVRPNLRPWNIGIEFKSSSPTCMCYLDVGNSKTKEREIPSSDF